MFAFSDDSFDTNIAVTYPWSPHLGTVPPSVSTIEVR